MTSPQFRSSLMAVLTTAALVVAPADSHAIFHGWGCNSCGTTAMRPATPTFAPAFTPTAACAPCGQTVNYMPQTAFRTVVQRVPVTTFQPVVACDPCGNRVTAMRPVVTMQNQTQLVPFTTFRPVMMPMASQCCGTAPAMGCCGTTPATTFSPVGFSTPTTTIAAPSGCSSCSAGSTTVSPSYTTPTYSQPTAPSYSTPAPANNGAYGTPGSTTPSLAPTPATPSTPRTFQEEGGVTDPESRLRPIPDASAPQSEPANRNTNSIFQPRLLDTEDRTTYQPRRFNVIPVADEQVPGPVAADAGWRSARR